ncbi:MAG: fimbria/pilus periplasmic chaperone [Sphaerochaetaceae bacterium]|jgi:fimbrial chaperone protein|nr:fimbria/pilus periplasmic chaperone [Sphaerochaetaceae bacterium]MDD3163842.1 fimbria/pilus periplasmic chaperone [Sphaerochaetaceae bacterium]MDD4007183.1 fimbria/pilus periplasmic chaperone [Sphaerochaetaceae bacterium]MDD4396497.1 fimbria/pilus periplasmic chaperone [Sphaerochaetaceae bacterium]
MAKRVFTVFVLAVLVMTSAFAFQFSPLEQTFSPTGADSTKSYTIVNDSDDSIAVLISALVRDQSEAGEEINADASRYFSIVPNKVIVQPRGTQIVRVQYRGPSTVTSELSFRLRAEQVQYSQGRQETNQNMFNFLYIYTTSLYVSPSKTVARLDVTKISPVLSAEGEQQMQVTLVNSGNVHQILIGAEVTVADAQGNRVVLSGSDALPGIDGANLLAKKKLVRTIPWPEGLEFPADLSGQYQGTISYSN